MPKRSWCLLGAALLFTPAALTAQTEPVGIIGFSSLPWGSTEADVVRRERGMPVERTEVSGLEVLGFQIQLQGRNATAWYYLHPEIGLVAGAYTIEYRGSADCWNLYREVRDAVRENYPHLRPRIEERTVRSQNHCVAVSLGSGKLSALWQDPTNASLAHVDVKPQHRHVQVTYMHNVGWHLLREGSAAERADRF